MREFYYVDREGSLTPGGELDLIPLTRQKPLPQESLPSNRHDQIDTASFGLQSEAADVLENLYPEGLTRHGVRYAGGLQTENHSHEAFFELVRQAQFPDRTSRFQCYFGCESLEDAETFARDYGDGDIWKVECEDHFRADMTLLKSFPFWLAAERAHLYWQAETNQADPFWEVLMDPPIRVLERV